jgi:cytochrome c553
MTGPSQLTPIQRMFRSKVPDLVIGPRAGAVASMNTYGMKKRLLALTFSAAMLTAGSVASAAADRVVELTMDALDLNADALRGAALYSEQCASCHGREAQGAGQHDVPALASQRRAYVIRQLAAFSERDRIATQMHRVVSREAVSQPQSWADLALYLNNSPPPKGVHTGDGKYLLLGEASYEQFCSSCHEEDGRGDDDGFVPSLRNQHYRYLVKEMRKLAAGHRFNVDEDLARFLNSLKGDEMQGLADYLSRMQGPVRDRAPEE